MTKELTPIERCKKNKWRKGTNLRCITGSGEIEYWKITAFGISEVLGIRINLKPFETTGETIIPFYSRDKWRKT